MSVDTFCSRDRQLALTNLATLLFGAIVSLSPATCLAQELSTAPNATVTPVAGSVSSGASAVSPCLTAPTHYECSFSPRIFSDLKTVYINIDIDAGYAEAIRCIGHEEECVKHSGTVANDPGIPLEEKNRYFQEQITRYKGLTHGYPAALYPDHLAALLQPAVKAALNQAVPKGSSCRMPEPIILDRSNRQAQRGSPDALTITLGIKVVDTIPSRIAILTTTAFRAAPGYTDYLSSVPMATAFPLDLPEDKIEQIVEHFVHITARVPWSSKDSVE